MKEQDEATEYINTERGKYVVGEFLWKGIAHEEELPAKFREHSNIKQIKQVLKALFPTYYNIRLMDEAVRKKFGLRWVCLKCEHPWMTKGKPVICPKCKTKSIRRVFG